MPEASCDYQGPGTSFGLRYAEFSFQGSGPDLPWPEVSSRSGTRSECVEEKVCPTIRVCRPRQGQEMSQSFHRGVDHARCMQKGRA